jgi:hypothetical protein
MRHAVALLLALACATGCYARPAQGGGPTIQRQTQETPDLAEQRSDRNTLPTAHR